jgi:ABC-type transporter Mla MlaB component
MFDFFDGSSKLVRFRGSCTIAACGSLKRELERLVEGCSVVSGPWTVDVEEIERVDFAFLQLILLFKRHLERSGGVVSIVNRPRCFSDAVELFSLEQDLE